MSTKEIIVPFLKWAGGKRWLTHDPNFTIPDFTGRYIEPFVGSGSLFFSLQPKIAVLGDLNADLIETYSALKDSHQKVLRYLRKHANQHNADYYYYMRDEYRPANAITRAARFLYLNRTCWNGLYRVNLNGKFNVPKGTKSKVLLDTDDFNSVAAALKRATILHSDFESIIDGAEQGDFIYADPPYTVKHNTNGFIKYNETLFSWNDQIRLRDALLRACARGAKALVSNANHKSVVQLYKNFGFEQIVKRQSIISGQSYGRGNTTELLVWL